MKIHKTLNELYSFPGFRACSKLKGMFGDSPARIVTLKRRQKKRYAVHAARRRVASTTARLIKCATWIPGILGFTWNWRFGEWTAACAAG